MKKEELKDLFDIEREAFTLAALIDAQRVNKEEYIENIRKTQTEAEQHLNDRKTQLNMEITDIKRQIEKTNKDFNEAQERNRIEFEYKLDDEISAKRKDYQIWADAQNAILSDQKRELTDREEEISKQQQDTQKR